MPPKAPAPPDAPSPEKEASAEQKLQLSVGEHRQTGRNKAETQDKGYYSKEDELLSVCDGVSTGDGGAAAELVSERFGVRFGGEWKGVPRDKAIERIVQGFEEIDDELHQKKESGEIHKGSSTVGGVIKFATDKKGQQYAVIGGVGDIIITRTFDEVDPNDPTKTVRKTVRLNPEESLSAKLVRDGIDTSYDPGPRDRKANTVYNSWSGRYAQFTEGIGSTDRVDVRGGFHVVTVDVQPGDEFAISTDGFEGVANDPADLANWAEGRVSPAYCEILEDQSMSPQEKVDELSRAEKRLVKGGRGKGDDELGFVIKVESAASPRPGALKLGTVAINKAINFAKGKVSERREARQTELERRRERLDRETESTGIKDMLTPEALDARAAALEVGVRMQRASRKEQRGLQAEFDEKMAAYQEELTKLSNPMENWSEGYIHTLRALDAKETRLQILEQTGLKGAVLEYMGKHRIKTAIGAAAVGLVLTGAIGFVGGGAATVAGGAAAYRAVRGYSTAISRRYAPGRMEQEGTKKERDRKLLKTITLGTAALGATIANMELGGNKFLSLILAGGGAGISILAATQAIRGTRQQPLSIETMTNSERAAFIAGGINEMIKEDRRTRYRAIGFTALSVIAGAAAAEYLHGAFTGGHGHGVVTHETHAPKATKSPTEAPSPKTSVSPTKTPTPQATTSPTTPAPQGPPTIPPPGDTTPTPGKSLDMGKALGDIKTDSPAAEISRNEGFYDHIDRLTHASPAFKNANLTPDQYREVMLRSGKELAGMKFANGEPIAYAVHDSGGHIEAYGFNSVGHLPPAANEVIMRHLAEVQGIKVANDPAAAGHLLDNLSFDNAVEHASVHNDSELAQNLYPKMSQLNALGVTQNDYATLTQQLHNNGFTFPANGQLSQAQLEQIVSTAASQKHIDLQAMHNLIVTSPNQSIESLFNSLPKELVSHQANAPFADTLKKIPQLQPLGLNFDNAGTVNNVAQQLQSSQPGLVKLEGQHWVFAKSGKLNAGSFQAILKAVNPKIQQQYTLAS